jgi:hypothetical protein
MFSIGTLVYEKFTKDIPLNIFYPLQAVIQAKACLAFSLQIVQQYALIYQGSAAIFFLKAYSFSQAFGDTSINDEYSVFLSLFTIFIR